MMHRKKKNNKAGLFFVLLVLVGYIFINFGQNVSSKIQGTSDYEKEVVPNPEECSTCGPIMEEEIVYEEPEINVVMIDDEYTVDVTQEVKGLKAFFTCDDYPPNTLDSVTKLCPRTATEWDVVDAQSKTGLAKWLGSLLSTVFPNWGGSNVKIDSEAEIELVTVTYPLAFFLGQYVMQNSNREANVESPNYPSSGQVIDEGYTLKTHTPQQAMELKEELQETVREDYIVLTDANILGGGNASQHDENTEFEYEVIVTNADHEPESLCDEDVTKSDQNPGCSNRQGSLGGGFLRSQIPGGDPVHSKDQNQCLEVNKDYKMINFGLGIACIDLINLVKGRISSIFSIGKWDACTKPQVKCSTNDQGEEVCVTAPAEDCLNTRNIGIEMSPIFGGVDECTEELCANAYLTNSYRAGLAPYQSEGKKTVSSDPEESLMFFLGTNCLANIKIGGVKKLLPVTCLWDSSPALLDYKLQSMYKIPNQEDFPETFQMHWELVEQAMELSAEFYGL
jgi:hypothetical protein